MNNTFPFIDGRRFLVDSPFRSVHFLVVTALGLGAFVVDVYILYRYRPPAHEFSLVLVGVLVLIQLVYQWWRILRYYRRIRRLYSERAGSQVVEDSSPVDLALRIAAGGLVDLLFYCYGIALILLVLIGFMMTHITPRT